MRGKKEKFLVRQRIISCPEGVVKNELIELERSIKGNKTLKTKLDNFISILMNCQGLLTAPPANLKLNPAIREIAQDCYKWVGIIIDKPNVTYQDILNVYLRRRIDSSYLPNYLPNEELDSYVMPSIESKNFNFRKIKGIKKRLLAAGESKENIRSLQKCIANIENEALSSWERLQNVKKLVTVLTPDELESILGCGLLDAETYLSQAKDIQDLLASNAINLKQAVFLAKYEPVLKNNYRINRKIFLARALKPIVKINNVPQVGATLVKGEKFVIDTTMTAECNRVLMLPDNIKPGVGEHNNPSTIYLCREKSGRMTAYWFENDRFIPHKVSESNKGEVLKLMGKRSKILSSNQSLANIALLCGYTLTAKGNNRMVGVSAKGFCSEELQYRVAVGDKLTIVDPSSPVKENILLHVVQIKPPKIHCRIEEGGIIKNDSEIIGWSPTLLRIRKKYYKEEVLPKTIKEINFNSLNAQALPSILRSYKSCLDKVGQLTFHDEETKEHIQKGLAELFTIIKKVTLASIDSHKNSQNFPTIKIINEIQNTLLKQITEYQQDYGIDFSNVIDAIRNVLSHPPGLLDDYLKYQKKHPNFFKLDNISLLAKYLNENERDKYRVHLRNGRFNRLFVENQDTNGYSRVLVLDEQSFKKTNIDSETLVIIKKKGYLEAYWRENGKVIGESCKEEEVKHIIRQLPKVGKVSEDKNLIKNIISKYDCTSDNYGLELSPFSSSFFKSHKKDGWVAFVKNSEGEIFASSHNMNFLHSSFMQGGPVRFAGEMKIAKGGKLLAVSNYSGHYLPDFNHLQDLARYFDKRKVDLFACKFYAIDDETLDQRLYQTNGNKELEKKVLNESEKLQISTCYQFKDGRLVDEFNLKKILKITGLILLSVIGLSLIVGLIVASHGTVVPLLSSLIALNPSLVLGLGYAAGALVATVPLVVVTKIQDGFKSIAKGFSAMIKEVKKSFFNKTNDDQPENIRMINEENNVVKDRARSQESLKIMTPAPLQQENGNIRKRRRAQSLPTDQKIMPITNGQNSTHNFTYFSQRAPSSTLNNDSNISDEETGTACLGKFNK